MPSWGEGIAIIAISEPSSTYTFGSMDNSILFLIGKMMVTQSKGQKGQCLYNKKLELEEIKEMETKKGRVDLDIKSLTETPDKLCLKADSTGKLTCVTQANLLKKTAK